eukprot:11456-Heterococcus_DN1.PRE.2
MFYVLLLCTILAGSSLRFLALQAEDLRQLLHRPRKLLRVADSKLLYSSLLIARISTVPGEHDVHHEQQLNALRSIKQHAMISLNITAGGALAIDYTALTEQQQQQPQAQQRRRRSRSDNHNDSSITNLYYSTDRRYASSNT